MIIMTVKDLKKSIQGIDEDLPIVIEVYGHKKHCIEDVRSHGYSIAIKGTCRNGDKAFFVTADADNFWKNRI
jgi:hypothetical protein